MTENTDSSKGARLVGLRAFSVGAPVVATTAVVSGCDGRGGRLEIERGGDDKSIGEVDLRSVLLVTREKAEPARLLCTSENNGDEAVEATISDAEEEITVSVHAQGSTPSDTVETLLPTAGHDPGARTTLTTTAGNVELLSNSSFPSSLEPSTPTSLTWPTEPREPPPHPRVDASCRCWIPARLNAGPRWLPHRGRYHGICGEAGRGMRRGL